jgi:cell division septation protein DedD
LKRKGLAAYVRPELRGRTTMYLVLVGPYTSYEQARAHRAMIREHVPDAILWP